MLSPYPQVVAVDAFMNLMQGIINIEGSETIKERHEEGLLVELFLKYHVSYGLKLDSFDFHQILQQRSILQVSDQQVHPARFMIHLHYWGWLILDVGFIKDLQVG